MHKKVDDGLFELADYRSRNRRNTVSYDALEKRMTVVRKALNM